MSIAARKMRVLLTLAGAMSALLLVPVKLYAACNPTDLVIAIDIGHTPNQPGAMSARGISEYEFNRRLSLELYEKLRASGFSSAFVINEEGAEIALRERVRTAELREASIFVSIHHDSVQRQYLKEWMFDNKKRSYSDDFSGYSVFVSQKNTEAQISKAFATFIGYEMREIGYYPTLHHAEDIRGEDRHLINAKLGIYQFDELVVLTHASMPAVLLEAGVIVNRDDEAKLDDARFRDEILQAVVGATQSICNVVSVRASRADDPERICE